MNKRDFLIGLAVALLLGAVVSPFSSPLPDGLERVAHDLGFQSGGETPVPESGDLTFSVPGFIGTLAMFGIGCGTAALMKKRRGRDGTRLSR